MSDIKIGYLNNQSKALLEIKGQLAASAAALKEFSDTNDKLCLCAIGKTGSFDEMREASRYIEIFQAAPSDFNRVANQFLMDNADNECLIHDLESCVHWIQARKVVKLLFKEEIHNHNCMELHSAIQLGTLSVFKRFSGRYRDALHILRATFLWKLPSSSQARLALVAALVDDNVGFRAVARLEPFLMDHFEKPTDWEQFPFAALLRNARWLADVKTLGIKEISEVRTMHQRLSQIG